MRTAVVPSKRQPVPGRLLVNIIGQQKHIVKGKIGHAIQNTQDDATLDAKSRGLSRTKQIHYVYTLICLAIYQFLF